MSTVKVNDTTLYYERDGQGCHAISPLVEAATATGDRRRFVDAFFSQMCLGPWSMNRVLADHGHMAHKTDAILVADVVRTFVSTGILA